MVIPKVLETPNYIELASTDQLLAFALYEGNIEITVDFDDLDGQTIEETVSFPKDDVIRFLEEVIKKFDGD